MLRNRQFYKQRIRQDAANRVSVDFTVLLYFFRRINFLPEDKAAAIDDPAPAAVSGLCLIGFPRSITRRKKIFSENVTGARRRSSSLSKRLDFPGKNYEPKTFRRTDRPDRKKSFAGFCVERRSDRRDRRRAASLVECPERHRSGKNAARKISFRLASPARFGVRRGGNFSWRRGGALDFKFRE